LLQWRGQQPFDPKKSTDLSTGSVDKCSAAEVRVDISRVLEVQQILEVAVAAPLMGVFDYLAPVSGDGPLLIGQRVRVPFGRSTRMGWLVGSKAVSELPEHKLRRILSVLDTEPLLPPDLLRMLVWAARYYQHPLGEVLAAALPKALREGRDTASGEMLWRSTPRV
jgi:primosomal protein N' (replication factor Y)